MSGNRRNRFGRNVRSRMAARARSRATGNRTRNTDMSRRRFLGTAAAGVAAVGLGLSGTTGAAILPAGGADSDPYGLLFGASTVVEEKWNPDLGHDIDSKVTAVLFHSDVVVGTNVDGSPSYIPSHSPGGLVHEPKYVEKEMNGIAFRQYSGELSGYGYGDMHYHYGPIDEDGHDHNTMTTQKTFNGYPVYYSYSMKEMYYNDADQTKWRYDDAENKWVYVDDGSPVPDDELPGIVPCPVPADAQYDRFGTKGAGFLLMIPDNWNGTIINNVHGGLNDFGSLFSSYLDPFYLMSQGFAYVTMDMAGANSPTDTNYNNDEYYMNLLKVHHFGHYMQVPITTIDWVMNDEVMFGRDTIKVMKNICEYDASLPESPNSGKTVEKTYLCAYSQSGALATGLATGRTYGKVYNGGNYETPYINCPDPENGYTPDPDAPQVYDGLMAFSPSALDILNDHETKEGIPLEPAMPISNAPFICVGSSSDAYRLSLLGLLFAYMAHEAASQSQNPEYWPVIKDTVFNYNFENLSHIVSETVFSIAYDGAGLFVEPKQGLLDFNYKGKGKETKWHLARVYEIAKKYGLDEYLKYWSLSLRGYVMYLNYDCVRAGGMFHQVLSNLHAYLDDEAPVPMPKSTIDPYWLAENTDGTRKYNVWPKLANLYEHESYGFGVWERSDLHLGDGYLPGDPYTEIDIRDVYGGVFSEAIDYIRENDDVLDYEGAIVRLPDDSVRRGLYYSFYEGFFMQMYYPFISEFNTGFTALDWDGSYIYMTGFSNPFDYLDKLGEAVQGLVDQRLFDPVLGMKLISDSTRLATPAANDTPKGLEVASEARDKLKKHLLPDNFKSSKKV